MQNMNATKQDVIYVMRIEGGKWAVWNGKCGERPFNAPVSSHCFDSEDEAVAHACYLEQLIYPLDNIVQRVSVADQQYGLIREIANLSARLLHLSKTGFQWPKP